MKLGTMALFLAGLVGCVGPATNLNRLSVGMTRSEVVAIMGTPRSVAAKGSVEYLNYRLGDRPIMGGYFDFPGLYYVRLLDGRVESFGNKGDFDSTKDPTQNLNIRIEQVQPSPPPPPPRASPPAPAKSKSPRGQTT